MIDVKTTARSVAVIAALCAAVPGTGWAPAHAADEAAPPAATASPTLTGTFGGEDCTTISVTSSGQPEGYTIHVRWYATADAPTPGVDGEAYVPVNQPWERKVDPNKVRGFSYRLADADGTWVTPYQDQAPSCVVVLKQWVVAKKEDCDTIVVSAGNLGTTFQGVVRFRTADGRFLTAAGSGEPEVPLQVASPRTADGRYASSFTTPVDLPAVTVTPEVGFDWKGAWYAKGTAEPVDLSAGCPTPEPTTPSPEPTTSAPAPTTPSPEPTTPSPEPTTSAPAPTTPPVTATPTAPSTTPAPIVTPAPTTPPVAPTPTAPPTTPSRPTQTPAPTTSAPAAPAPDGTTRPTTRPTPAPSTPPTRPGAPVTRPAPTTRPMVTRTFQVDRYRPRTAAQARVVARLDDDRRLRYREDRPLWGASAWQIIRVRVPKNATPAELRTAINARTNAAVGDLSTGLTLRTAKPGRAYTFAWELGRGATAAKPWGATNRTSQVFVGRS